MAITKSNVVISVDSKGMLTAKIDPKRTVGVSKSGKSINVGTTNGNTDISGLPGCDGMRFSINCYRANGDYSSEA